VAHHTTSRRAPTPHIDVIVPVHDEADLIERKLDDLSALTYAPDHVRILLVDGASTDGTWDLLVAVSGTDARFTPVRTDTADKTHQLNVGLQRGRAAWVVV